MHLRDLDALVLAGGSGTRLSEILPATPKVIAPVAGRPFVTWLLGHLSAQGLRRAVLCTGQGADEVERVLGSRVEELTVRYSREAEPLGTGGALRNALPLTTSDPVFVLNGDSLLTAPLAQFLAFHDAQATAAASLALAEVEDTAAGGCVEIDGAARVVSFVEKGCGGPGLANAGAYLVPRARLEAIPTGRAVSLEREILPAWIERGLWAWRSGGSFVDIGSPAGYRRAESFVARMGLE